MKNYIVLDLEWNQSDDKRSRVERMPFEIIEIGAVKVDAQTREVIDEFDELIRPVIYPRLFPITRKITHIDPKDLKNAGRFKEVAKRFFDWCGEDYAFCTWGSMDLTELQRNMEFYGMRGIMPNPLYYYDAQKMFGRSLRSEEENIYGDIARLSLEDAVDALGIERDIAFHRAIADTIYTARVMKAMNWEKQLPFFSVDYHNPPADNLFLEFPGYNKVVTRVYEEREEVLADPMVARMTCTICGRKIRQKIRWFAAGKNELCAGICPEHGYIKGKSRPRKADTAGGWFVIKTTRPMTNDEFAELRERKNAKSKERARRKRAVEKKYGTGTTAVAEEE